MIKKVLAGLTVLVVAVLLGQQLIKGSGYFLLVMPDGVTSIEMSFWVALALLLLSWLAAAWLLHLLGWLVHPLRGIQSYQQKFKSQRALQATAKGLADLALGRWRQARKRLVKAAKHSGIPLVNYLAAAQAAYYEGKDAEVETLLKAASSQGAEAAVSVDFIQAKMQLQLGQYEQALATLVRLHARVPKHPEILRLLKDAHLALEDWKPLAKLLPALHTAKAATPEELAILEKQIYLGWFTEPQLEDLTQLKNIWNQLPPALKKDEQLVLTWLQVLLARSELNAAEQLLYHSLKESWSSQLIERYGLLPAEIEPKRRLLMAEKWLKERPYDARLLHALARISQQLSLWKQALEYYQASYQLESTEELCLEMSQLYLALGETSQGEFFRNLACQGIQKRLPQLPLPSLR